MWVFPITVICLAALILEVIFVALGILTKSRSARIAFVRGFKKGKCVVIYFTAIPLYCVGHMYAGKDFLEAFFSAVNKIINLVVLKYDTASISTLMAADSFYRFTIYFCFVLVGLNALLVTFSLTAQYIWCGWRSLRHTLTHRSKLLLFGNNPENIAIYQSDKVHSCMLIDRISDGESAALYTARIAHRATYDLAAPIRRLFGRFSLRSREHILIFNTKSDEANMTLCRTFIDCVDALPAAEQEKLFLSTKIYVFGDPRYTTIYTDIVSSGHGCIHYVNKYQMIATDFIDKYPLSRFMDDRHIDYDTSMVRENIDINLFFIGFGNTNQQLFLTSVANNQFLCGDKDAPTIKRVRYHILDRDSAEQNKNLNHSYYRYKFECSELDPAEYLPFPELPAEEIYRRLDVNDSDFYTQIRSVVTRSSLDANFIVIAFGTDLENLDMAQKLVEKRREWGIRNLTIFVKVRVWHKTQTTLEENGCYFIGNERDVVYIIDAILGDKISRMAQMRNEVYDIENYLTKHREKVLDAKTLADICANAHRKWYKKKTELERESSLYCCLSLRSKLHMMGLDYTDACDPRTALTEAEYLQIYAGTHDRPDTTRYDVTADGKPIVSYPLYFPLSRRRTMAIHEHHRWNAFMISKGLVPASRELIRTEQMQNDEGELEYTDGKWYPVRRHGCLTTFEGLYEFRRILAARDHADEADKDVIKYDYQLLDDAYWLLSKNGYKIVRRAQHAPIQVNQ